jgi:predicted RecB family nuclease
MLITDEIFEAFIKCETKSYLKLSGAVGSQTEFSHWQQQLIEAYKQKCSSSLRSKLPDNECLSDILSLYDLENKQFRIALGVTPQAIGIKWRIDALEQLTSKPKYNSYIPIRFVPNERITRDHKLLLAFDALALKNAYDKAPLFGRIIHGREQTPVRVYLADLIEEAESVVNKITAQQTSFTPPTLILNKHCVECEFREPCRQLAIDKDEISLLSGMTKKERSNHNNKGIFSITQLSYTFRLRRKPKRLTFKPNQYSHALKALAIRENKIHVACKLELKSDGNRVYLDVEGDSDRGFYYLIGLRVRSGDSYIQHSFWANDVSDEKQIFSAFLCALKNMGNPRLIHYGSYETVFLKRMKERYADTLENPAFLDNLIAQSTNLLSMLYARVYFPTYSNGLKEVARYLGFQWSDSNASGIMTLIWRSKWESTGDSRLKQKLVTYNAEDCEALEKVYEVVAHLCSQQDGKEQPENIIYTNSLRRDHSYKFGKNNFSTPDLEYINQAAYWDYQRERIYLRSSPVLNRDRRKKRRSRVKSLPVNKVVECEYTLPSCCPKCGATKLSKHGRKSRTVCDIKFGKSGIKRWNVRYIFQWYICTICRYKFLPQHEQVIKSSYGPGLLAYIVYQLVEVRQSQRSIPKTLDQLYGLPVEHSRIHSQKAKAASQYKEVYEDILRNIVNGQLIHADETKVNLIGKAGYVWVLANMESVAYIYSDTREGDSIRSLLENFKGVLVSDFYTAYDSIECAQQRCLIHLIRDLNDDLLKEPFNQELKDLGQEFGELLKPTIATIDRYGLKGRFLKKHKVCVERFYKRISRNNHKSETAIKWKKRFNKNRERLFTFLDYDGIPWNNNNAEHAIKAFVRLRRVIGGTSTEKGIREYLVLLSLCETCKCKGISFLDFLRSGERNIEGFSKRKQHL